MSPEYAAPWCGGVVEDRRLWTGEGFKIKVAPKLNQTRRWIPACQRRDGGILRSYLPLTQTHTYDESMMDIARDLNPKQLLIPQTAEYCNCR